MEARNETEFWHEGDGGALSPFGTGGSEGNWGQCRCRPACGACGSAESRGIRDAGGASGALRLGALIPAGIPAHRGIIATM